MQKLNWREDTSNLDLDYLRNYIRQRIVARMNQSQRRQFLAGIKHSHELNNLIEQEIATLSQLIVRNGNINRQQFRLLPLEIGRELLAEHLRHLGLRQFDRPTVERLSLVVRAAKANTRHSVKKSWWLVVGPKTVKITPN